MWIAVILLCASLSAAVNLEGQFAFPEAPRLSEQDNATFVDLDWSSHLLDKRQGTCYSPNRWCASTNKCCGPDTKYCCTSGVCGRTSGGDCCGSGQCEAAKPNCCADKSCIGVNDDCCSDGGYCPAPFTCIRWYRNNVFMGITCCTDESCDVYWSNGATLTRTSTVANTVANTVGAATILATATERTTTTQLPVTRTAIAGASVDYYSTTIYWTYYYYYYTLYYSFSTTTTTRVRSTVISTTTLTCTATDTSDAQAIFLSLSNELPTPTSALTTPPVTPTPGAFLVGSCSRMGTTSDCETVVAGAIGTPSSTLPGSGLTSDGCISVWASTFACLIAMSCSVLMVFL